MAANVIPKTEYDAILTALCAAMGRYNGAKVKLFKNDVNPSVNTLLADLTEADFSGYVESAAVTWGAVGINGANQAQALGDGKQFTQTASTIQNTVYGYFVVDTTEAILLWAVRFDTPVQMQDANDFIYIVPTITLGGTNS